MTTRRHEQMHSWEVEVLDARHSAAAQPKEGREREFQNLLALCQAFAETHQISEFVIVIQGRRRSG